MRTVFLASLLFVVAATAGCGGSSSNADAHPTVDSPPTPDSPPQIDAPENPDAADPTTGDFDLAGGANGLAWDAANSTLYLTNNDAGTLVTWTDADGLQDAGTWPASTTGWSLGDLVIRTGGAVLTPNFGMMGAGGAIYKMSPAGTSVALTGLDATRKRIGLAQDPAGLLYVTYFTGNSTNATGYISSLTMAGDAGVETDVAGGAGVLKKVVGLVATADALFASDQTDSVIYKFAIPGFTKTTVATVPSADLLYMMPNGDLLTSGTGVHRVTQAGAVTTIFTGFESVRGMAYDPALGRLFFLEHSTTPGTPDRLHIRPLAN